jgi:hypothetical protein
MFSQAMISHSSIPALKAGLGVTRELYEVENYHRVHEHLKPHHLHLITASALDEKRVSKVILKLTPPLDSELKEGEAYLYLVNGKLHYAAKVLTYPERIQKIIRAKLKAKTIEGANEADRLEPSSYAYFAAVLTAAPLPAVFPAQYEQDFLELALKRGHLHPAGHFRRSRRKDELNLSMLNFAKEFNAWIEGLGYEFKPEERFPYTQAFVQQRKELLDESNAENPAPSLHKELLNKRFQTQDILLASQTDFVQMEQRKQLQDIQIYKQQLIYLQIDKRIKQLESEMKNSWILFTQTKAKKVALLTDLGQKFRASPGATLDSVLGVMKAEGKDLSLLKEGRTGKLLETLRGMTSKPADRITLIDEELVNLRKEQKEAENYWFFAKTRQKKIKTRIEALENLKACLLKPGYRVQEVVDSIQAKNPAQFAALTGSEKTLLKQLKEIDAFTPDHLLGKKVLNLSEAINQHEAQKAVDKAAQLEQQKALREAAQRRGSTPHFFSLSAPRLTSAPAPQPLPLQPGVVDEVHDNQPPRTYPHSH